MNSRTYYLKVTVEQSDRAIESDQRWVQYMRRYRKEVAGNPLPTVEFLAERLADQLVEDDQMIPWAITNVEPAERGVGEE